MPTYVYKFIDTGETVEVQQAFTDDTLTEIAHPGTGQPMAVRKVFTPVGVTFKGGGFYKTDSRGGKSGSNGSGSNGSGSDSSKDAGSGSKDAGSGSNGSDSASSASTTTNPSTSTATKDSASSSKPAATPATTSSST